jgi:hypothetical protein
LLDTFQLHSKSNQDDLDHCYQFPSSLAILLHRSKTSALTDQLTLQGSGRQPVERNLTAYLPTEVIFSVGDSQDKMSEIGSVQVEWWEQERYDIRNQVFSLSGKFPGGNYIQVQWTAPLPEWVTWEPPTTWFTFVDEIIINPK